MKVSSFFHGSHGSDTTLSEIKRVNNWAQSEEFLGAYAYATQSGAAAFDLELGTEFWGITPSKWIFGIDYGRTQPAALRFIAEKNSAAVRIHDGEWLLQQPGFIPRRDFHAKAAFLNNDSTNRYGVVAGSGNFSASGLRRNVEAGVALQASSPLERERTMLRSYHFAQELWDAATPLEDLVEKYEEKWDALFSLDANAPDDDEVELDDFDGIFWIEAGYVTKNRGDFRPGNQIDLPRGMSKYFGFDVPPNLPRNSFIGEISFRPPTGDSVSRNLRLGNNLMEKITLPIPEAHGFDLYDGKVLVFWRSGDGFEMRALETDDFEKAFADRLAGVRSMASGRRYGHIV